MELPGQAWRDDGGRRHALKRGGGPVPSMHDVTGAEEVVRRRIAQELHENVGGPMAMLGRKLALVADKLPAEVRADLVPDFEETGWLLSETANAIEKLVADLRAPLLEDDALPVTLRWYAETLGRRTGLNVALRTFGTNFRVSDENGICLLRIAQEVLSGVAERQLAPRARMVLQRRGGRIRLSIVVEGLDEAAAARLAGIREMQSLGGRFRIMPSSAGDTRIVVDVAARH